MGPRPRHGSPVPGGSILITSAPKSDMIVAAAGPAIQLAQSITLSPENRCSGMLFPALSRLLEIDSFDDRQSLQQTPQTIQCQLGRTEPHPLAPPQHARAAERHMFGGRDTDPDRATEIDA